MAEKPKKPVAPAPTPPKAQPQSGSAGPEPSWKGIWQLPALLGAVMLLSGGVLTGILTAPKADLGKLIEQAARLAEHEDYEAALEVLNKKLSPHFDANHLNAEQARQFHLLRARSVYLAEKKLGLENEKNAELVVDEYTDADPEGTLLEPRDRYFLADANVTLGRTDRALFLAAALPATERENRGRVVKRVVERRLQTPQIEPDETLRLLADFLKETELTVEDRAWALARQAELLLRQGFAERAIAKLVQTMPSLVAEARPEALAELYLLLGKAYWESGAIADAGRQLEQASALLLETDLRRGEAEVILARIYEQSHQPPDEARQEAKQRYASVVKRFGGTAPMLAALLGLGEVTAAMGELDAAVEAYAELVRQLNDGKQSPDLSVTSVTTSLLDRYNARADAADVPGALRFAVVAEKLYSHDTVPPEVLLAIANADRRLAEGQLGDKGEGRLQELVQLDPATREQVRLNLLSAGQYFKRHADRVGIADNTAYGNSLWFAADSFDRAGDPDQAIPLLADYVKYFPSEPRQAEARYKLGQSYESRGDYGLAANYYRALKDDGQSATGNTGPYGDMSYVPLARVLLLDGDPANDAESEQLLETVVKGGVGDTSTPQFRDALIELGELKRRRGDYAGAIMHLDEAVTRFPGDARIDQVRYNLADSYRQDARAINRSLDEGMPDARKQALRTARVERLNKARVLFEQVRRGLEGRDARRLTPLEQLQLRNSYFYLGDCAFDLKDHETAIHHYDAARERYPKDPASLAAMIQIVNAYVELGDLPRARTANNRARAFYESLPASAWSDPRLPMDKADWQRWLDSMAQLSQVGEGKAVEESRH